MTGQTSEWRWGDAGGGEATCPKCGRPFLLSISHTPGFRESEAFFCPYDDCGAEAGTVCCTFVSAYKPSEPMDDRLQGTMIFK
jgi:hypothetical protein